MASFRLFSVFSYINTNIQHMWKIIRSLDSNIRPLEFESPPITTRPGHPLYSFTLQITCESFRIKTQLSATVEVSALQKPLSLSLSLSLLQLPFEKGNASLSTKHDFQRKTLSTTFFSLETILMSHCGRGHVICCALACIRLVPGSIPNKSYRFMQFCWKDEIKLTFWRERKKHFDIAFPRKVSPNFLSTILF